MSANKPDPTTKKLIKMLKNYGLNINSMSDEELERMREQYQATNGADIDEDLKESEEFSDEYSEDII